MFVAGDKIGAYVVQARLGAGGMGEVYIAEHVHIGRKAAIKVLLPELALRPDVVARFFNEARATGLLRHPNIVEVLDCDVLPSGHAYIVMELLGGESLAACLARVGSFAEAWPTALAIAGQIASGLSAAHAKGIVHRDLKPDNIYLVATRHAEAPLDVKVLDFGIAKLLGDGEGSLSRTSTGSLLGTPVYMSPEQCRGAGMVDHRADIYSLGCMLFEMLAGQPPFVRAGAGELIAAHMFQPAPPLDSLAPSVPTAVVDLVAAMLAKLPGLRPQTMADVIAAIEPVLQLPALRFREAISVPPGFPFPREENPGLITSQPGSALTPAAGRGSAATELAGASAAPGVRPRTSVLSETGSPQGAAGAPIQATPGGTLVEGARAERSQRPSGASSRARPRATSGQHPDAGASTKPGSRWAVFAAVSAIIVVGAVILARGRGPKGPGPRPLHTDASAATADATVPAVADRAPLEALLRGNAEPSWPAACATAVPALVARLVDVAKDFAPGAPAVSRSRRLANLANLPDSLPERWLIEARVTLTSDPLNALRATDRAVALCPSSAVIHNLRGNALQKLPSTSPTTDPKQVLEDAAAAYQKASELAPDYAAPRFNLGLVRLRQDRAKDALEAFEALARGNAGYPNIHLVRAEAYRKLNQPADALAALKEHVQRQPDSADGWWQLSRALSREPKPAREAACRAKALGHPAAATAKGCT